MFAAGGGGLFLKYLDRGRYRGISCLEPLTHRDMRRYGYGDE